MRVMIIAAILLMVIVPGCGKKGDPIPPKGNITQSYGSSAIFSLKR